jgi:putative ABC transport system permease protein
MMTLVRIACADLWHDRRLGACTVLGLAAVLAPLLVLAGMRLGVIGGLREALLQDPNVRQILSAENREIPTATLAHIAARPDVAFLVPRTRTLAASLPLQAADGTTVRVELIPSAAGDPLLPDGAPATDDAVVLSAAAAARLGVAPGARLLGRLVRIREPGGRQLVLLDLRVQGVAPLRAFGREAAFVSVPLAAYIEAYQDGRTDRVGSVAALPRPVQESYPGFRLYARRLEDVPGLDAALRAQGLTVVSRAADVAGLLALDTDLGLLFWFVAGLGGAGYLVSLGSGLWASVERRRGALALLRFLGMRGRTLALLPVMQSVVLAACGAALALAAAGAGAVVLNAAFAGTPGFDRPPCQLSWGIAAAAVALTLGGAAAAASAAGWRIGRVQPWEILR